VKLFRVLSEIGLDALNRHLCSINNIINSQNVSSKVVTNYTSYISTASCVLPLKPSLFTKVSEGNTLHIGVQQCRSSVFMDAPVAHCSSEMPHAGPGCEPVDSFIPPCPGIHISCFVRDWWQSQTNLELT
jgi:hypothetical protein